MQYKKLYSIGHSNHTQEEFFLLLTRYGIDCVVDVRSVPASKYAMQFNEEILHVFLRNNGIRYLHFGVEFGARRLDCLDEHGQVDFEKAINTANFEHGVERLYNGFDKGFHISLMCSEANPLDCHRFSLVSRYFYEQGVDILHIQKDGTATSHAELEKKMISEYMHSRKSCLPEVDQLFGMYTEEQQRNDAYRLKNKEIGWKAELQYEEMI